ncbi:unnamed protein product [Rhizophagus irregularis]|nr:unnamed protein product [Rhizophagus irregularis]
MSSGPSKVSKGRPPSDVWCNHMIQGNMQSRGHYSATCSYCRQYWRQGRPQVLSAHLANHCKKCPDDVSLYFAKIVGKNLAKEEEESADEDESDYPNKKVRQTGIKNFYGGGKIEKGRSDELDQSMPTDDYKELRNSCISIFNKRYKEFDEDIYLLGFFLHPKYRGHGMRDNQFERLRNS